MSALFFCYKVNAHPERDSFSIIFLIISKMKKSILILATSMMMYANGAMAQHEVGAVTLQPKAGLNIACRTILRIQ